MARVVLDDTVKIYPGNIKAVDHLSLEIDDCEFIVFVGPSGCGKSTTLRMIAGLEEITSGIVKIGDRIVNDVAPKDRDIAMVFQNYALYPHMSVYKNLAFGLKLRKLPRKEIEDKVKSAAKVLGIEDLLNRKPKALSGGQRQRVAVGRAIVRNPACFLFDEPLSNLDALLRVEMRAEIKRLHMQLQTTTIYVTHDQEEAMTLGDRIVVMLEGIVQQCAAPLEVYRHPENRFVAKFVGTPPMNFATGTIVQDGDGMWFDEGDQRMAVPEWAKEGLAGKVGSVVELGLRPEVLSEVPFKDQPNDFNKINVTVDVIEPLGDKMDVHMSTPNIPVLLARLDARLGLKPGDNEPMYVDMNKIHFFEPSETGVNLCLAAEKAMMDT